jgi:hypothetical protein
MKIKKLKIHFNTELKSIYFGLYLNGNRDGLNSFNIEASKII